jgi:lipoprotein signal peptidase
MRKVAVSAVRQQALLSVVLAVLATDQLSKLWAVHALSGHIDPLAGPFGFQLVYDPSSSFSRISHTSFALLATRVLLVVALALYACRARQRSTIIAAGLAIGGVLGNVADVFTHSPHGAVDLLEVYEYLNFNLADVAAVMGVVWLATGLIVRVVRHRPLLEPTHALA